VAIDQLVAVDGERVDRQAHRAHQHRLHHAHRFDRRNQVGHAGCAVGAARVGGRLADVAQRDLHDVARRAAVHGLVVVELARLGQPPLRALDV
jgi:hypothetical protein